MTARNFNEPMAKAGKICVVEVEEIVETGTIPPDDVHLQSIYVNRIIKGAKYEKRIERLTLQKESKADGGNESPAIQMRNRIIKRAAMEFCDGMYGILLEMLMRKRFIVIIHRFIISIVMSDL